MVETRRSSSSSKRPLPSPSSPLPSSKRSKDAITGAGKKSGRETVEQEVRSDDHADAGDLKLSDAAIPEKFSEGQVEAPDAEKSKSGGALLTRGKKRQLKSNAGVAWGKLLSQCSQQIWLLE